MYLLFAFLALLVICGGYVLSTHCRKGNPDLQKLIGWAYAHRGLHREGVPENSLAAFAAAKEHGFGSELDVHLMADGGLAVIHDASLLRTAGVDLQIEALTVQDLDRFHLEGTAEKIPTLQEVLELYDGECPLIIELKPVKGNHGQLCEAVCNLLDGYRGPFCLESFDPRCIRWLKKNRSEIVRGQLTENFFRTNFKLPWFLKWLMKNQLLNFTICPDFVAYRFADRKTISNVLVRRLWGATGVTWTIKNLEDYRAAVEEGWLPIFEGFIP